MKTSALKELLQTAQAALEIANRNTANAREHFHAAMSDGVSNNLRGTFTVSFFHEVVSKAPHELQIEERIDRCEDDHGNVYSKASDICNNELQIINNCFSRLH